MYTDAKKPQMLAYLIVENSENNFYKNFPNGDLKGGYIRSGTKIQTKWRLMLIRTVRPSR